MSRAIVWRPDPTGAPSGGCCISLGAAGATPLAVGTLLLRPAGSGWQQFIVVAGGLPPPASLRLGASQYVVGIYGGGGLRVMFALQPTRAATGTLYAGGVPPSVAGPLSEVAITAEPPFAASLHGPVVLAGSFAFCR